jgi:hypothetical protein
MAYTTINKPNLYFNTALYTGTGSNQTITVGFQPDLVWTKGRSLGYSHEIQDAVRGTTKVYYSDNTNAEGTTSTNIQSFNSTGYVQGSGTGVNGSSYTFVSWNWLASNTTAVANTAGTISSTVSANTTAGFSIVSYTGNGTGNSTIGHGLGAVPKFIIVKARNSVQSWGTLSASYVSAADPNIVYLNQTAAQADDTNVWGTSASFNSSTFTVGTWNGSNANGTTYIAYCWSEVKGYSKFGSYVGNGSADGTFVYTGFKPAMVIAKRTDSTGNWRIRDNKRSANNVITDVLYPNTSDTTITEDDHDFLSNGFKVRTTGPENNASGGTFIYMAFAEQPLVGTNNVPATAR